MTRCPTCRAETPAGANSCRACGQSFLPPINEPPTEEITVGEFPAAPPARPARPPLGQPDTIHAAPGLAFDPDLPLTDPLRPKKKDSVLALGVPDSDPKPPTAAPTMLEKISPVATVPTLPTRSGTIRLNTAAVAPPAPPPRPAALPLVNPVLRVVRGERTDAAPFRILDGKNYIGRFVDKPVDIDLTGQEPPDQVWASRQHAVVTFDRGVLTVEDLNSLNGTFVNRTRIHPGRPQKLAPGDVVQIGMVQMRVEG